jgi:hypothetical protein
MQTGTIPDPCFFNLSMMEGEIKIFPSELQIIVYPMDILAGGKCNNGYQRFY